MMDGREENTKHVWLENIFISHSKAYINDLVQDES